MSLRDKVLATIGDKIKQERELMTKKAEAKAKGTTVAGERMPKVPKSKGGDFMNIRHMGEYLLVAGLPDGTVIGPMAFAEAIHNEFPESVAGSANARGGKELGHYPYYRRYILDGDVKFKEAITAQLADDGLDFATQLSAAQEALDKTITRRKKDVAGETAAE
jgi:hypothetical protein